MNPVKPILHKDATLVTYAKTQTQFKALPASVDAQGVVMTEWEPTAEELDRLLSGGNVRLWVFTYGNPLQPVQVEVAEPKCGMRGAR